MKKIALMFALLASASTATLADQYVNGHVRKDGTYVQPHYRSDANSNRFDNYSSQGNYNPYTGKEGTVNPYQQQPFQTQQRNHYDNGYRSRSR